jgi:hypothetical protein
LTRLAWVRTVVLAALVLAVTGAPAGSQASTSRTGAPARPVGSPAIDGFRSTRTYNAVPAPVRLRVPAAHVDTPLQRLGRAADGTVAVPASPDVAGWFAEGPRPGQPGPAVMLGHVDSTSGPGVFYHLAELAPGAVVSVDREDGSTVGFRVTALARVPKTGFPTDQVYAPTLEPSLELVTCGGSFDRRTHSYRDNVIVYAVPV